MILRSSVKLIQELDENEKSMMAAGNRRGSHGPANIIIDITTGTIGCFR